MKLLFASATYIPTYGTYPLSRELHTRQKKGPRTNLATWKLHRPKSRGSEGTLVPRTKSFRTSSNTMNAHPASAAPLSNLAPPPLPGGDTPSRRSPRERNGRRLTIYALVDAAAVRLLSPLHDVDCEGPRDVSYLVGVVDSPPPRQGGNRISARSCCREASTTTTKGAITFPSGNA